jgi:putative membrane protein
MKASLDIPVELPERPHPRLMTYYLLSALAIPPLFPILILPLYFRYHTMRYRFDAEGISMRWGILFRREVVLNYARIQDIQLRSNVVERWLGLARIELQTAAGSSGAEMTLEGSLNYEAIRDFLYQRMRGVRESGVRNPLSSASVQGEANELVYVLREVATELRSLREALEQRP